ncbi:mechanosensitive ion channel family protein [Bizionia myxarmorum]|uniref:mechanosensitive ion channel family protein n=1 Tax=Bizionia myxarmorum TaxID=291186 RepID=UPI001478DB35|nr:mechanosensitive ion channel domain-containing protein [Bizionia myxarmorum]
MKQKFNINGVHKAKERKVITQLRFIKSISIVIILTLAIAVILWNIPAVRKLGTTILTSAGVIGIIFGVAAQKSISNLITGFQIAFTQPIKIDDEVVVEGEFGTVEDITLTYVVVKIWDWRRLVLPLNYFNDNSFVNWTFNSQEIIGSVFFHVDYMFPVVEMRKKLLEILKNDDLWDKNVANLLVTNSGETSMELRATFSARNASDIYNLRCKVREKLIEFIQENHEDCLPKIRQINLRNTQNNIS